ncbi:hypothetical protein [Phytohabitans aurantiacus]|uniref:Uncharacterized protein n=1 Tax=Phytohabitans aurantiacus TaxID=3016789 RepID=A0ABQ5QZU3_9ACTN|nr:hypothetical protein [Phytohabitans aurantiacus]GLH99812.1 hypothetical protein Pa4123_50890 [Phytohabitans aurantiacus]
MIDKALVLADLQGAVGRWTLAGGRAAPVPHRLDAVVDDAVSIVAGETRAGGPRAMFCVVTKGPHLATDTSLACVAARLSAFGVTVSGLRRISDAGRHVVESLYPLATRYFDQGPTAPALWDLLADRFDRDEFLAIFGCRYDSSLVVSGARAIRDNGLTPGELTRIWETGRRPVSRDTLIRHYGGRATSALLGAGDATQYDWFRGRLPVGISRIASSLTAFALRDDRLYAGAPVIVINGHVPGLVDLFDPVAWLFDLGIEGSGVQIGDVRRALIGDDSRPEHCRPGSLRRDAVDHLMPLADDRPVTSRFNLVHSSDGLLAGLTELRKLAPDCASGPDLLTAGLIQGGLTDAEIERIVLADPRVLPERPSGWLTDMTCGLDLKACTAEILRFVPPVFGPANQYADGVRFDLLDRALRQPPNSVSDGPGADAGVLKEPLVTVTALPDARDEARGTAIIAAGGVGVLAPAGGTGGRFGGYGVPETDPARQKALVPAFIVRRRRLSAIDIRLANVRHWDAGQPGRVPMAVMASPTSQAALHEWRDRLVEPYRRSVRIFAQHGIYRIDVGLLNDNPRDGWVDVILRDARGRPSLKPSGGMGLLSCFVLSGLLDTWEQQGISYIASANGDDVGYRLNPGIIGYLDRHPMVDGVLAGVPWGFSACVQRAGVSIAVRGDESGWSMDETGSPLAHPLPITVRTYDVGGALCMTDGPYGSHMSILDGGRTPDALFNTNQTYLRLSAIRRILNETDADHHVEAVRRLTDRQPLSLEDKVVMVDGVERHARQLSQPAHGILAALRRVDVVTLTRRIEPGIRGTYAALKNPADVRFGQLALDRMQEDDDDLLL